MVTKLLKQYQYDLLSTIAFNSVLNNNNLRPAFKERCPLMDFNDAPYDTLLMVTDVLAPLKEQRLDISGGYLLSGSVIVKLSPESANRIAWIQTQTLKPKQELLYADICFTATLDVESGKYDLFKIHRKAIPFFSNGMKGKVIPLDMLNYASEPFEPNVKFSLESLGIK